MSQHDYNIANQTFSATRTDLNDALVAVATNNAGNSAPSTTYANQWWFDSDGNTLYMRNKDNDAWVTVLTIGATSDDVESLTANVIAEGTSATGVTVDGMLIKDGGFTATVGSTITTADNTDTLTLTSTDADANVGPNLRLYRNSASPADSDTFGQIEFEGRNDNSQDFIATQIKVNCGDVSDGNEGAQIEFDVMTGGTLREYMRMAAGSNPAVIINQDSRDINFQVLSDGQANMLFVDGGGNHVLVDHTGSGVSQVINGETPTLQVRGNTYGSSSLSISNHQAANAEPSLIFYKSRNATPGSFTSIADNDNVGHIWFAADDGTDGASGVARIVAAIDGTPGANDTPGRMQFYTTADGANSPTERMRIHSNGVISSVNGIALGVGTANTASNVLDDYEEGTYTVALTDSGGNVTITMNSSYDEIAYTKVGRLVTFGGTIVVSGISGSWGASDTTMFTLPFASADLTDQAGKTQGTLGTYNTDWTSGTSPYVQIGEGGSLGYMYVSADNAASGRVQAGSSTQFYIGGHYYTA